MSFRKGVHTTRLEKYVYGNGISLGINFIATKKRRQRV